LGATVPNVRERRGHFWHRGGWIIPPEGEQSRVKMKLEKQATNRTDRILPEGWESRRECGRMESRRQHDIGTTRGPCEESLCRGCCRTKGPTMCVEGWLIAQSNRNAL
jgi:hypothetical protein